MNQYAQTAKYQFKQWLCKTPPISTKTNNHISHKITEHSKITNLVSTTYFWISRITFTRYILYVQIRKIGKLNNLKVFRRDKAKGCKQDLLIPRHMTLDQCSFWLETGTTCGGINQLSAILTFPSFDRLISNTNINKR